MASPRTIAKLEARIKERAAYCVQFELADPRACFITITRVELASDLSSGRVFYSVLGSPGDRSKAQRLLDGAAGFVQRQVARVLKTRRIPRLAFVYDESIERAIRLERSIREAIERDRTIHPGAHPDLPAELESDEPDDPVEREYEEFLSEQDEDDPSARS